MAIFTRPQIKSQVELLDNLRETRFYYKYKAGDEYEVMFRQIERDLFHEINILLIMCEDWIQTYRKPQVPQMVKYKRDFYDNPSYLDAIEIIDFIRDLIL